MEKLTIDQLPELITDLNDRVQRLEKAIRESEHPDQQKELLSITEASALINLSKSTIYILKCRHRIPFLKKGGRLYFKRSKLMEWIESGSNELSASKQVFKNKRTKAKLKSRK